MALKESFNGEARLTMIKRLRKHTYAAATALLVALFALSAFRLGRKRSG